jgi:ectoine hydroxylase-related dioxygenase (phytanoyl-CoA dioxygenase family)
MWPDQLNKLGFAILPGIFGSGEIASVRADLGQCSLPRSRAGIRHLLGDKTIAQVANDPRLLAIAQEILGPDARPFHATLFGKSPAANWLVVWHQDTALPLEQKAEATGWGPWSTKQGVIYAHAPATALEQVLALRVHLDASTLDNGPLRILPGTHNQGVLTDDAIHEIAERVSASDCKVESGGVLAMRPLTVHASSKSRTDAPRRVLHIEYSAVMNLGPGLRLACA